MAPTVGLTIVFYREFFANSLITRLSFVLFHILRDALFSGGEFAPEGALHFIRDGEHQVGPDGQAAGRGKEIHAAEGSDIFLCEICNVLIEEKLKDKSLPFMERLKLAAPVITAGETTYTSLDGRELGRWSQPMKFLEG